MAGRKIASNVADANVSREANKAQVSVAWDDVEIVLKTAGETGEV